MEAVGSSETLVWLFCDTKPHTQDEHDKIIPTPHPKNFRILMIFFSGSDHSNFKEKKSVK